MKEIARYIAEIRGEKLGDIGKVIEEGRTSWNILYYVTESNTEFYIKDREVTDISESEFITKYTPKFGKYEIEDFIGRELLKSLLIGGDISNIFHMNICCDDRPYNIVKISQDRVREELSKVFTVIKTEEDKIFLKFKWKPFKELDK
ncbi:MAG: hypothetical protein PHR25_05345 [Clostridia bacterium]|nr:hypothetical protein [Clostridia bacterium]MDD4376189.1 hypothetical protein [Clostridia bacterium]